MSFQKPPSRNDLSPRRAADRQGAPERRQPIRHALYSCAVRRRTGVESDAVAMYFEDDLTVLMSELDTDVRGIAYFATLLSASSTQK
jgi:hypothetical protein